MLSSEPTPYRAGIDLGGTKIEIAILSPQQMVWRKRIKTPSHYADLLEQLTLLVNEARSQYPFSALGIAMPGAVTDGGTIKNANTTYLIGKTLQQDLQHCLGLPVRLMNDANCFALSEAIDGAGQTFSTVFGVIIGTGTGGAIVQHHRVWTGVNSIAGEWGHNALCRRAPVVNEENRPCYCGKNDCVETYLSGKGLKLTAQQLCGEALSGEEISERYRQGDKNAIEILTLYAEQLAASLSVVINIVDPDVIVLGGGLSNLPDVAALTEKALPRYVFSDVVKTQVKVNLHGDSSGVRGAAWLWSNDD